MALTIKLQLQSKTLLGLEAIDRRRALQLSDGDELIFGAPERGNRLSLQVACEVDEAFARAWFAPQDRISIATVPVDLLTPDDVEAAHHDTSIVGFRAKLPNQRIKDLYVAARFWECSQKNQRLQEQMDAMRSGEDHDELVV